MSNPPSLDAMFCEAIELPSPEARAAYVADACDGDDALRRQVESLVDAHFRAGSFLGRPGEPQGPTAAGPGPEAAGSVIGSYRLREPIGEGGMGVVYAAEQTAPVRRLVALKVIKPGMDTREVIARFEAERQALALMDHPNIAKVFDGGATEAGRPFFVMELVRGLPITEYCDRAGLGPRDRLRLFAQVCRAVQHAHQKGVIHRDLKPTNVLVVVQDGVPVPKVIDFGLAKAVGRCLTDRTLYTGFGQFLGTPLYTSPEQAGGDGLDVDTRTDVYALGVILYELLTGMTPFDGAALRRVALEEIRRIIREEEPPRPSQRVSKLAPAERSGVSGRRGLPERRLIHLLRGDLDWVAMRALEKDRARRYESAGAFAVDVERYLADVPVEASPPSAWYRLRKAARRNRAALLAAGLMAATLVAGTAVSVWQAVKATEARRQAEIDRDRAREAELRAEDEADVILSINEYLRVDLLGPADEVAWATHGLPANPRLTVREVLNRSAAKIGERFHDRPVVEAGLRTSVGEAYARLGDCRVAVTHLRRAVELRTAHLGPDHPDTLASAQALAGALAGLNRFAEAIPLYEKLLDSQRSRQGSDHPRTIEAMVHLASAYREIGRLKEATDLFEEAFAKRKAALSLNHPEALEPDTNMIGVYRKAGEWDRAIGLQEALLKTAIDRYGHDHPNTVSQVDSLGGIYALAGRHKEAIALQEQALKYYERTAGADHPVTVNCLHGLGRSYLVAGQLDQAERSLRDAAERRQRPGDGDPCVGTAHTLALLGLTLLKQGRSAEAEPIAREALTIYEALAPDAWGRYHAMSLLGDALLGQRRYAAAEPLLLGGYDGLKHRQYSAWIRQLYLKR